MKYGFTLIELLAVIVILAIILMIATPMVMNVIDSAKHSAARSSAQMFVRQVEQQLMMAAYIDGQDLVISDGTTTPAYELTVSSVKMSELPKDGDLAQTEVTITPAGVIGGTIAYQGYRFAITAGKVALNGVKY